MADRQVILVTGGSRGIGAATSLLAAEHGFSVAVNYLHHGEAARAVVDEILRRGGRAVALPADVSQEAAVVDLFDQASKQLGPITALVNNAGTLEPQTRVELITAARLERVLAVNVIGSFLCAREAVRRMSRANGGSGGAIVNVSSVAARLGAPGEYVDYAASKAAIDALTIGLAKEVAGDGIRVNAVRPGYIYTDIHSAGGEPGRVDRLKDALPMKRGGDPCEVAEAILWLLSEKASYCTGSFLEVAGGR